MAKLNISQAAKRVGVSRQTFYRHIEKKGISTTKDAEGNPLIDVSELLRVYGELQGGDDKRNASPRQRGTLSNDNPDTALQVELDTLRREKMEALEARAVKAEREADLWREQAETLRRLLTDQRPPAPVVESASSSPAPEPVPAPVDPAPQPETPALPEKRAAGFVERVAGWFGSGKR